MGPLKGTRKTNTLIKFKPVWEDVFSHTAIQAKNKHSLNLSKLYCSSTEAPLIEYLGPSLIIGTFEVTNLRPQCKL